MLDYKKYINSMTHINNPLLTSNPLLSNLLNIYDKVMILKIYVDNDCELKNMYLNAEKNLLCVKEIL